MKVCDCGNQYTPSGFGNSASMCKSCLSNRKRWQLKLKCISFMGGKCSVCSYDRCPEALDFHHIDPSTKSFEISGRMSKRWSVIEDELKKCVLLCANCHREEHWKQKQYKTYMLSYQPYAREPYTRKLSGRSKKVVDWPPVEELILRVKSTSYHRVSDELGCSDNAIRKYLRRHGIDPKSIRSIKDNKFVKDVF